MRFSISLLIMVLTVAIGYGQTQQKSYSEKFNVDENVEIDVNTSYTNLELDTWNRKEVVIEAEIEIEGVSEEEAAKIFKNWNFKAVGNSGKITISTEQPFHWKSSGNAVTIAGNPMEDLDFAFDFDVDAPNVIVMPDIPELAVVPPAVTIPPVPMPPLPKNLGKIQFDYEKYKKDGDKYLKEWKEEFSKNFDEDYKKEMEKWKEKYAEEMEKYKEEMEKHGEEYERIIESQSELREEQKRMLQEQREAVREAQQAAREAGRVANRALREAKIVRMKTARVPNSDNIYFYRDNGENKNLKIKKTIKIKAPKGAKLNLNVRHGEVKLVQNFKDINATLSYTRLLASNVGGEKSVITASYSPVIVDSWEHGQLNVNFAKEVLLKKVNSIKLQSKSSEVVLGEISGDALIKGSFGDLEVQKLSENFKMLDIVLDNSDASLKLPDTDFKFYSNATDSKMSYPQGLVLNVSNKYNNELAKGYNKKSNSDKTINLLATYSEVSIH